MQHTYCQISQEVKAVRQWNLVTYYNITWGTSLLKNGETSARPYFKKLKLSISLDQWYRVKTMTYIAYMLKIISLTGTAYSHEFWEHFFLRGRSKWSLLFVSKIVLFFGF